MTKMIEIRKDLRDFLKSKHPDISGKSRVWSEEAPDDAVYPFIVYDFPSPSVDDGTSEVFTLDLEFFDDKTDTTALETLCAAVDDDLNKRTLKITETLSVTYYRDNRRNVREPDKRLRRRQYTYQVRVQGA